MHAAIYVKKTDVEDIFYGEANFTGIFDIDFICQKNLITIEVQKINIANIELD